MSETVWYRSLYWRIAIGFVTLVAGLLVTQALVFLWLTGRTAELWPGRSPAEFAQVLANDVASALEADPDLAVDEYVGARHASAYRPFAIVFGDGRTVVSQRRVPSPMLVRAAFARLTGGGPGRRGGRAGGRGASPAPVSGRGGRGRVGIGPEATAFAPVTVQGATAGMVAVPLEAPPLSAALRDFGPVLATVALGLLAIGTAVAALLVFRPAHRRLRTLEQAARALGEGQIGVRATETGGDEVAALARTFNEMAQDLGERSRALVEADRTRRQLLADVSHELMTPLAAIRGYVETLGMSDVSLDDATRRRYLQIVSDETERLEHIVGDLLDLAKLEGGGGELERDEVAVAQLAARVRERHERALEGGGITLEVACAPDVRSVWADQNRLEQALQNLVANAVRHTPTGGKIRVSVDRVAGGVRLAVEDNGPGIPPEHLARVFDRFYKVDTSRAGTATPSGSGLGLSIVRAIVVRHGGTVTASAGGSGGARFEIVLPDDESRRARQAQSGSSTP